MKYRTVLSASRNDLVELLHHDRDPGTWIVQRWRKQLWFKRRCSSDWFNSREQALAFAGKIMREHGIPNQKAMAVNAVTQAEKTR